MKNFIKKVKKQLKSCIYNVCNNHKEFVVHPESDFTRKRKISMENVINFIFTMEAKSLSSEMLSSTDYDETTPTVSAFIQDRDKIKVNAFKTIFKDFTASFDGNIKLFKGYRLLAHDGSDINIPNDSSRPEAIIQTNENKKEFSLLHFNALYDLVNKRYVDVDCQYKRKCDERRSLCEMVDNMNFQYPTIILADRGYEAFNTFEHINKSGQKFLIRAKDAKSNGIVSGLELPKESTFDTTVTLKLTRRRTKETRSNQEYHILVASTKFDYLPIKSKDCYEMKLRVVRIGIEPDSYECLITNLDSSEFSIDELKKLYHLRWGIETSFRELKYALGLASLHCKKDNAICQEIYSRVIMYNYSMMIAMAVKPRKRCRKATDKSHRYQINFTQAIGICRAFFKSSKVAVDKLISRYILPVRDERNFRRNLKRKGFLGFNYRTV